MLTHLATAWPPRITHAIARLLGIGAALREICPCGTCGAGNVEGQAEKLTRIRLVMESLGRTSRDDEPLPADEAAWADGYVAASHVAADYLRGVLEDSDPFWRASDQEDET
jgi:hypothetical protein